MSKGHCPRLNRRNHLREDEMPYVENSIAFNIQGNEENFFLLPFGFSPQKFEVKNGVQFQVPLFFFREAPESRFLGSKQAIRTT